MALLTSRQIGDFAGVPERTIRDWQLKGIVPETEDMAVAVRAIVVHFKTQNHRKEAEEFKDDQLYNEKVRLTRLQADKLFLDIQVRESELVNSQEVELAWSNYIMSCRSRLLGMPARLAYELAGIDNPNTVQDTLQIAVDEALVELGVQIDETSE
jgi:phage terminase Nu1 subunit (DNA packaging protein)